MDNPLVSIAIPVFNAGKYLQYAIQSVLNQTYTNWELLIIDDGSSDNSLDISRSFTDDDRIEIRSDGKNIGLPARLNESVKWAKGKYYARMDADDIMHFQRIETQVNFLEDHPNVDVLGASMYSIDSNNNLMYKRSMDTKYETTVFIHPSVIGKTLWFLQNPYDTKMSKAQDIELWLRTEKYSIFYSSGDALMFYREFGVPTFKKYTNTMLCMIKNLYSHPRKYHKNIYWATNNMIRCCFKVVVCAVFSLLGKTDVMLSLRKKEQIINYSSIQCDLEKSMSSSTLLI